MADSLTEQRNPTAGATSGGAATRSLQPYRRVVVKIGSSLLVERGRLRHAWLDALAHDIAELTNTGRDLLVVSSGAIALGRGVLGLAAGELRLEESQAAAAVGQIALARAWSEVLGHVGLTAGQILLTPADTEERRRYLNARSTIATLLKLRAVPVINENDSVATSEIRYGDNDRLAARVASMMSADLLVLLSDIAGLHTAPPASDPNARLIETVERITPQIEAMAGDAAGEHAKGGMRTKIAAGKIANAAGVTMIIASGAADHPLRRIAGGEKCTWFLAPTNPVTARKRWISGTLETRGALVVDDGAVNALRAGKSLLPAGVRGIHGEFQRGDAVKIVGADGHEIGRGLVAYDAGDARRIAGRNSREIEAILGFAGRAEMIHRDDMALRGE
jgi:glutamate 5-kinase